jgi:hypothetical protein
MRSSVADDRQSIQIRERLAQDFKSLASEFGGLNGDAGGVTARSRQ